jgi:hypothetical protein
MQDFKTWLRAGVWNPGGPGGPGLGRGGAASDKPSPNHIRHSTHLGARFSAHLCGLSLIHRGPSGVLDQKP